MLDRPEPPEGLTASVDGDKCVLMWKRSKDDGGAPIEHYQVCTMMHYWQEVVKVMEITGRNPSSRIKDSQIRGRSPSVWEFFFLLQGLRPVIPNYLKNLLPIVTFLW